MSCERFPHKRIYWTRNEAKAARKRFTRKDGHIVPFLCDCGFWHLGTPAPEVLRGEVSRRDMHGNQ